MSQNPAQEAELRRLTAEQAADDSTRVSQWHRSLDAPLTEDGDGSLYEVVDDDRRFDAGPRQKRSNRVTPEQVREWRTLRNKERWTYQEIADYAGVRVLTVQRHISQRDGKRFGVPSVKLMERLDDFIAAYEAGACMREIAEIHYEELGYKTWESMRQQLRVALMRSGVVLRRNPPKHGMRAASAPQWMNRKYQRERNRARARSRLIRCDATVRSGRPCRRWAIGGSRYCVVHDERARSSAAQRKWTKENVIYALRVWAKEHGRLPKTQDWATATDHRPGFSTVADLFGRWNVALYEAGLRERKHAKQRKLGRRALLNRGYKECARAGCSVLVAPSRHYCRDRQCQDLRWRETTLSEAA